MSGIGHAQSSDHKKKYEHWDKRKLFPATVTSKGKQGLLALDQTIEIPFCQGDLLGWRAALRFHLIGCRGLSVLLQGGFSR